MHYRADIDGLRAIAVILVILFHLDLIPGGFVGVDVFFVISGYLITDLIRADIIADRFSFMRFYQRRARRILPALLVMVLTVSAAGYVLIYPGEYVTLGWSALYTLAAISNFFFLHNTGYFDAPAQTMPLLHTWSLGVEEQFYLVWPALLFLTTRLVGKSMRAWAIVLSIVAIASFIFALIVVARNPKAAFYLPYGRAWELAVGGLIALTPRRRLPFAKAFSLVGLAGIGWGALALTATDPFPGWNAILPVLGASLFVFSDGIGLDARLLGRLAPVGKISYSLYLWHWPLIVLWRIYNNGLPLSPLASAGIAAASFVLATLSWRFVEQPVRRAPFRGNLRIALLAEAIAAACVAGVILSHGFPSRIPPKVRALGDLSEMWQWTCPEEKNIGLLRYPSTSPPYPTCIGGAAWETAKRHAILWGDSNAQAIMPLLSLVGRREDTAIAIVDTCPPIIHEGVLLRWWPQIPTYNGYCEASRRAVLKLLAGPIPIDLVILAASWTNFPSLVVTSAEDRRSFELGLSRIRAGFDDLIPRIKAPGRRIVMFGDVPKWLVKDPWACTNSDISLPREHCSAEPPYLKASAEQRAHAVLRSAAKANEVSLYLPEDYLCVRWKCRDTIDGDFIYRDADHLRRNLSPQTLGQMVALLQLKQLFEPIEP